MLPFSMRRDQIKWLVARRTRHAVAYYPDRGITMSETAGGEIVFATAEGLSIEQLAEAFTLGYTGYFVPITFSAERMQQHITNHDIDLRASWAAFADGVPVALCLLGQRGGHGWIGGVGVAPDYRRRGVARALMQRVHQGARERGLTEIMLEVLVQNVQAKTLYEQLGYQVTRRLLILEAPADLGIPAPELDVRPVTPAEALAHYAAFHPVANPWQRAPETLRRLPSSVSVFIAFVGGVPTAYVIVWVGETALSIHDLGCTPGQSAVLRDLVVSVHAQQQRPARLVNLGEDDPAWEVLASLGYREIMAQWEMRLRL